MSCDQYNTYCCSKHGFLLTIEGAAPTSDTLGCMTATPDSAPGRRIRGLDASERASQRRDLLLDSALELFARDGYANTSIETLCQHAYVGNKAFYEHFSTKEACYLELLQRNTHTIVTRVATALENMPDDEDAATRALITALVNALVDDPRIASITFGQAGGISPVIERQRRSNRRQAADIVLSAWQRFDGRRLPKSAGPMAVAVVGGLFDQISDMLDRTDNAPTPAATRRLVNEMTAFVLAVRAGMKAR